jgi:regulator of replication initiation timing
MTIQHSLATDDVMANEAILRQYQMAVPPGFSPTAWQQPPVQPRRAGHVMTAIGAACGIAIVFGALERFAPLDYKPSSFVGAAGGNAELHHMAQALPGIQAQAAALAQENARLEQEKTRAQAELAQVQAEAQSRSAQEAEITKGMVQNVVNYYSAIYQRGNVMSQATASMMTEAASTRSNLVAGMNGGRVAMASLLDLGAGIASFMGDDDAVYRLQASRQAIATATVNEYEDHLRRALPAIDVSGWAKGLPTPEELQAQLTAMVVQPRVQVMPPVHVEPRANPPSPLYRKE